MVPRRFYRKRRDWYMLYILYFCKFPVTNLSISLYNELKMSGK